MRNCSLDDSLDEAIDSLTACQATKEKMISERMKMTNAEQPTGARSIKFTHL